MYRLLIFLFLIFCISCANFKPVNISKLHKKIIAVDVKGAVEKEGIYYVKNGFKINDILKVIKIKNNADLSTLNLNQLLFDNDVLNIKYNDEKRISINNASLEELTSIKGIGEKIALRIIEYRNLHMFKTLDELKKIKGISNKKFEMICEKISL